MRSAAILVVTFLCGCQTAEHRFRLKEGYVPDAETAIKIAVAVWEPIFGAEKIADQKPYRARLSNGIWMVRGSLPESRPDEGIYVMGGVAEAEIAQKDGKILRVSHGR